MLGLYLDSFPRVFPRVGGGGIRLSDPVRLGASGPRGLATVGPSVPKRQGGGVVQLKDLQTVKSITIHNMYCAHVSEVGASTGREDIGAVVAADFSKTSTASADASWFNALTSVSVFTLRGCASENSSGAGVYPKRRQ